ncbi:hypothetical protein [Lamprocystis purpurea]|uniref:hypothetical protein n=1 Tax=Lamprocystis purpurea TaxID=61598 RepID=UPI00036CE225|nr:hypothetical protein [Lamprocystis purpurea]
MRTRRPDWLFRIAFGRAYQRLQRQPERGQEVVTAPVPAETPRLTRHTGQAAPGLRSPSPARRKMVYN